MGRTALTGADSRLELLASPRGCHRSRRPSLPASVRARTATWSGACPVNPLGGGRVRPDALAVAGRDRLRLIGVGQGGRRRAAPGSQETYDADVATVRDALGEGGFPAAWASGAAGPLQRTIEAAEAAP